MSKNRSVFDIDGVPPLSKAIPLGMQHILAMFVGNITVPIIIAGVLGLNVDDTTLLIQSATFVAGIITLLQLYPIGPVGAKLPIVTGTSFAFLTTCITVGLKFGLPGILGAQLIAGVFMVTLGAWIKHLKRFFPPIVMGTLLLTIGLTLVPVGVQYMGGGVGAPDFGSIPNLIIAFSVLITVVVLRQYTKGFTSLASILIGIIFGYFVSILFGKVDFTPIAEASVISFPKPFSFGMTFNFEAIMAIMIMSIVQAIEAMGDITGITVGGAKREPSARELSGGVMANGVGLSLASIFNTLPVASYSQNVGLITLTGIMSRFVVAVGAVFLIITGLFPKMGAAVATIPAPVLGGATIVTFSVIAVTGINLLTMKPLSNRDIIVVGLSIAAGLAVSFVPEILSQLPESVRMIAGSGTVMATFTAVLLNTTLPKDEEEETQIAECELEAN